MKKEKEIKTKRTMIGGQALMEGVMMRGKSAMAMAVRAPDGSIMLETTRLKGAKWYNKVPIVRGVVSFVSSLVSGMSTLMRSADVSAPDEEKPGKGWMVFAVILGVVLAVGLFILLPGLLNDLLLGKLIKLGNYVGPKTCILIESLFEGLLRILIFVLYLFAVSRMKDIRRTFMYHGAEHRTINCYERGYDMTVENVQKCSTRHNRCGTTFLFLVMIISILVFALVRWVLSFIPLGSGSWSDNRLILTAARIVMLPVVAGLSYEVLRGLAKLPDNGFTNFLRAPGLAMQRLTTYPPEDDMAEVALRSFLAVLEMDGDDSVPTVKFGEYRADKVREEIATALTEYGLEEREREAETDWILCYATGARRGDLHSLKLLSQKQYSKVRTVLRKRTTGVPLDYAIGQSEFYGHKLIVSPAVHIPRMETELLAEQAILYVGESAKRVLDLCTGSGCVALAIAKATRAQVVASELYRNALEVASKNLAGSGVELVQSNMFEKIEGKFDVIVCNPPYIRTADIDDLAPEVRAQPYVALCGGDDGLTFYRRIAESYREHLEKGGCLFMEIGYDQAAAVCAIFGAGARVIKDLDGNDRIVAVKG